jgi:hypothetical protein
MTPTRTALLAAAVTLSAGAADAATPSIGDLVSHRAVYALGLARSQAQQVVGGVSGTMTFTLTGACDGWTVEQQYDSRISYVEGPPVHWMTSYSTWESRDGRDMTFSLKSTTDDVVETDVRGEASLDPKTGGEARLRRPEDITLPLSAGTLFPTYHTAALVDAMRRGDSIFAATLFDGTDEAGSSYVSAVIGRPVETAPKIDDPALKVPSRRVTMAFFDETGTSDLPSVEIGMRLYDNGVGDDVTLDYGDFVMRATMVSFETLPTPTCP